MHQLTNTLTDTYAPMTDNKTLGLANIISEVMDINSDFMSVQLPDEMSDEDKLAIPETLPILPLRNTVIFPGVVFPIAVGRDKSLKLVRDAYKKDKYLCAVAQISMATEDASYEDLYRIGTISQIVKILDMPDGSTTVILQGKRKACLTGLVSEEPYITATVESIDEIPATEDDKFEALIDSLKELSIKIIQLSPNIPQEAAFAIKNIESAEFLVNYIAENTDIEVVQKQSLLEFYNIEERAIKLLEILSMEVQKANLKNEIQNKVQAELDQQQKEYILNQHIRTIQEELGGNPTSNEINELKEKAKDKRWPADVDARFKKEIVKLERMNAAAPDYSVQINYLQTLIDLPWNEVSKDKFDLKRASKVLDKDHFGLEQVKERILEHLAILKLKGDMKAPIICLYGPPGVGKTSLGKSIAKALNRKYIRVSLGGLHDEAEIRGHRKTYIGAMPGRIIQNLIKAKTSNPVFVLDEIDKIGNDFRGDPSFALLEVLDPEQNNTFYDNYLELDYDLSKVLFIATANYLETMKPALLDRMELINVSGYIMEEKVEIASRHLMPKQLEAHGLNKKHLNLKKPVLEYVVENYTRESGVRSLEKKIAKIARSVAKKVGMGEEYTPELTIEDIKKILGKAEYNREKYSGNEFAGVVTGLAWTSVGGEILFIETSLSPGKGNLTLTGNLGQVMKESAVIALEYVKSHASELDIPSTVFDNWNIHLHVPEGAVPKDGPSAGITMATALASALTQRKIRAKIAMTGEITLRGKVLPVGGIKEKILAAKRSYISDIILSRENEKDIEEIKDVYIKGLTFHYVDTIMDVFKIALLDEKVAHPVVLVKEEKNTTEAK
jgi:ATP-dependent Lon protease